MGSVLCREVLYRELGLSSNQSLASLPKYFLVICCNTQQQEWGFQFSSGIQVCGAGAEHLLWAKFHSMTCTQLFQGEKERECPF